MSQLIDEKCRCLLSALKSQYANALQLEDFLSQYKLLRSGLDKEKNDMSNELLRNVNLSVEENRCLSIPVGTYNTDVLPVTVRFLDGKSAFMLCPNFYKLSDVRPLLAKHATTFDPKDMLLGFSQDFDGELIFLDENVLLEKICGKSKSLDTTLLIKFYMPDVLLLDSALSRHQLYLQLRQDLSASDRLFLAAHDRIQAAGFAVLAEGVDRNCLSVDSNRLSGLVGWRVVEQYGNTKADSLLRAEVNKLDQDLPKTVAELEFCKIVQTSENYGKRYYRIYAHKDFEVQLSSLYISLSVFGVTIEESSPTISADLPPTVILHTFSWRQISRFSFAWHRLTISIKQQQGLLQQDSKSKSGSWVLHYYIRKKAIGNYLLQLAADLNAFQMSLLQTYRIDRIIFPRSTGGPFDTSCRSATLQSLPRHDVEVMAIDHFSSTMPRKHCANGLAFENEQVSPIFAFSNTGSSGRASAPPSSTNNLLTSSTTNEQTFPIQNQLPQQKQPLIPQLPQLKSDSRIGLFKTGISQPSSKWMSLSDFRQTNKSERHVAAMTDHAKSVISGDGTTIEQARVVETQVRPENDKEEEVVEYNFAASLVPADKVVQGIGNLNTYSELFQVVLQRDAGGSIGFSLSLDSSTRHLVVKKIRPGGAAERSGQIALGDRLVQIGDYNLSGKDYDDCVSLLRSISFPVKLTFERPQKGETNLGSGGSRCSSVDEFDHPEECSTEAFDKLSYPNNEVVPEELMLQPSYPVDQQDFDEVAIASYNQANMVHGGYVSQSEFDQPQNKASEDVVHEEMTYPSGSDFSVPSMSNNYTDEPNPYAITSENIDEGLIEKMLDVLGDEVDLTNSSDPTFQLDVFKLNEDVGFGFNVLFNNGRCTVTHVEQQQAETSGLAIGDVITAVNGQPVDECSLAILMQNENTLQLTLLACVDIKTSHDFKKEDETVCYDFRLPTNNFIMPQQLSTVSEIFKVSVIKQPCEELGCSLFACGSEIFIGTVKPGSKLAVCGVQSGDMCLLINNEPVFGMPSEKVAMALRSAAGEVTLTLSRRKASNKNDQTLRCHNDELTAKSQIAVTLGRKLPPALRADLRRISAGWQQLDIDDHDKEFTHLSSRLSIIDSTVTRPSDCQDLDAVMLELDTCRFLLANIPNQRSVGYFWQLVSDCNVQVMVILGDLPHGFFPLQCDEVLRVNLPSASNISLSLRLLSSSTSENLTLSKFGLTRLKEDQMLYLVQYAQQPEVCCSSLADALLLPHLLIANDSSNSGCPIFVCSDGEWLSFDQRGVYCAVSSILSHLLTSATSPPITSASICDSAAQLRRQHPDSLRCVEQLECFYQTAAFAIECIVAEDALSY